MFSVVIFAVYTSCLTLKRHLLKEVLQPPHLTGNHYNGKVKIQA